MWICLSADLNVCTNDHLIFPLSRWLKFMALLEHKFVKTNLILFSESSGKTTYLDLSSVRLDSASWINAIVALADAE